MVFSSAVCGVYDRLWVLLRLDGVRVWEAAGLLGRLGGTQVRVGTPGALCRHAD